MDQKRTLDFPYEFKEITPEEQELVDNNFISGSRIVRVGPKGYLVHEPYKTDATNIYNMPLRSTDIFVASYQRSGTTWTQELVWLLANDLDYETAAKVPLTSRYAFLDLFQLIGLNRVKASMQPNDTDLIDNKRRNMYTAIDQPVTKLLAKMSSPRFIKTHLPMSLLNPDLLNTAKVVYVARDPRDVAVSCYHHARFLGMLEMSLCFKEFWNMFYKGIFTLCPLIEHVKEAWDLRHHHNMFFLFYEDLSKDLPASICRIAKFLKKELSENQINQLSNHLHIDNFKKNESVNLEHWTKDYRNYAPEETFIRKGKTGGWRDYFDDEMSKQAKQWIKDSLKYTDLRYPLIDS